MQTAFKEQLDCHNPIWMNFGPDETAVEVVESFGHYEAEYAAIRKGAGILHMPWLGVVNVGGSERLDFLNNMLTHDTKSLTPWSTRRCFWLSKQGRVEADLTVLQQEGNCLLLTDRFSSGYVAQDLGRFIFAEDVDLQDVTDDYEAIGIFGPAAMRVIEAAVGNEAIIDLEVNTFKQTTIGDQCCLVIRQDMGTTPGLILLTKAENLSVIYDSLIKQVGGIVPDIDQAVDDNPTSPKRKLVGRAIGWAAFNTVRIESGMPMFRVDFGQDCLPHETNILEQTVSFTKGCYLGQEVVARMESRGHPKRKLVGIKFDCIELPMAGTHVQTEEGDIIGGITSSTNAPLLGQNAIAIAMMKWGKHRKGTKVTVPAEGKFITGTVCDLQALQG